MGKKRLLLCRFFEFRDRDFADGVEKSGTYIVRYELFTLMHLTWGGIIARALGNRALLVQFEIQRRQAAADNQPGRRKRRVAD